MKKILAKSCFFVKKNLLYAKKKEGALVMVRLACCWRVGSEIASSAPSAPPRKDGVRANPLGELNYY